MANPLNARHDKDDGKRKPITNRTIRIFNDAIVSFSNLHFSRSMMDENPALEKDREELMRELGHFMQYVIENDDFANRQLDGLTGMKPPAWAEHGNNYGHH